jgi:hypothetical protein
MPHKNDKKALDRSIQANVKKEMAKPRIVKSVRTAEQNSGTIQT